MVPICVAVVLHNHDGKVATTARRHDPNSWGLPGGKVDPEDGDLIFDLDNTLRRAAVRELAEETGVVYQPEELTLVYAGVCTDESGGGNPDSITFTFEGPDRTFEPTLKAPEGEPEARWNDWSVLLGSGAFGAYNLRAYNTLLSL